MKTIEERAEEFASVYQYPHEIKYFIEECFIISATVQEQITKQEIIKDAKQWLKENVDNYLYNTGGTDEYIPKCGGKMFNDFEKAMLKK